LASHKRKPAGMKRLGAQGDRPRVAHNNHL
jgi:hypothetical protein